MNAFGKPIKNVQKIHFGQKLFRVMTFPMTKDDNVNKHIIPGALNYAAIEIMQVEAILPNESRTGLLLSGMLINKKGEQLFPGDVKKSFKDKIDIPFDQENVAIQPGVWFDDEKVAQAYAKTINMNTKNAIERIKETFDKFQSELDDFIKNGV